MVNQPEGDIDHPPIQALLILGTRTLAVEVADLASEIPGFEVVGFVENMDPQRCREPLEGLPVLWVGELAGLASSHQAVCALGTTRRSRFTDQVAAHGMQFASLVHPLARLSRRSAVGAGSIVSVGAIVAAHTHLGRHVIVNRGAMIGHHTTIGDYVTLGPGANVAGACQIGDATYVGIGAIVLDHVTIGAHSVVGAGAVVTKDLPGNVQVTGIPARIVKTRIEGR